MPRFLPTTDQARSAAAAGQVPPARRGPSREADDAAAIPVARPVARRYHVHGTFLMYCAVALLLSVGAFHNNNNLLFWLFSFAFSMIVVSGLVSGPMLMGVRLERLPPPEAVEGDVVRVAYRVTNVNRWMPAFALAVREVPAPAASGTRWWRGWRTPTPTRTPAPTPTRTPPAAPAPDPDPSSPAGLSPRAARLDRPMEAFVAYVPAGKSVVVEGLARATARGTVPLAHLAIFSDFPFGIVRKSVRFHDPRALIIRPASGPDPLPARADPRARPSADDAGLARAASGEHFHALREYQPGDSPRIIAWRASARAAARDSGDDGSHGTLLVRQTTGTAPGRIDVVLDLAAAPSEASYESAIRRAAGLMRRGSAEGLRVGLVVRLAPASPDAAPITTRVAEPRSGRWQAARLLNDLAMLPAFAGPAQATIAPLRAAPGTATVLVVPAEESP